MLPREMRWELVIFSSPLCKWLLRLELDILVHLIYRARDEPSSFHGGSFFFERGIDMDTKKET